MKVLYLPLNVPGSEQVGMVRGFKENGLDLTVLDYLNNKNPNEEFITNARELKPDWIHCQLQEGSVIRPEVLKEIRDISPITVCSQWNGDIRIPISKYQHEICQFFDVTLIVNEDLLEDYSKLGSSHVGFWQTAVDPDIPPFNPPFAVSKVVFCGNNHGRFPLSEFRLQVLSNLTPLGLGILGCGWPSNLPVIGTCTTNNQPAVYQRAQVSIGTNHYMLRGYYSDRQLFAMVAGVPHVCQYAPGLEKIFKDWEECIFFDTTAEAMMAVRKLLMYEDLRIRIGRAGRACVLEKHTWTRRIKQLWPVIAEIRDAKLTGREARLPKIWREENYETFHRDLGA